MTHDEARALIAEANIRLATIETARQSKPRGEAWGWLWANTRALVTGYAEALEEVERLSSTAWAAVADDLRRDNERLRAELLQWKSPCVSVGSTPSDWICPTCKDPKCGDV